MPDPASPPGDSAAARSEREELSDIWEEHRPRTLARIQAIRELARRLRSGDGEGDRRAPARLEAHTLGGAAAIFGLPEGLRLARQVEARLDDPAPLTEGDGERLEVLADALHTALDRSA
jgi:HPt (histidine-containing phosphotransfer) domain-containing protein